MRRYHHPAILLVLISSLAVACASRSPGGNDRVTSGMAEKSLVPGETTQQQVIEAFGAPNIVTKKGTGSETWTYERVSFDSSYASGGAGILGGGLPGSSVVGGAASVSAGSSSSGTRTVTLIIYFNETETVHDYRVMETHF